jgi:hypothetical protein
MGEIEDRLRGHCAAPAARIISPSYSAKAEYPVRRAVEYGRNAAEYWIIRFRG